MKTDEVILLLKELKLYGMVEALQHYLSSTDMDSLDQIDFLKYLSESEISDRENRRLKRLFSSARFREPHAALEKVIYKDDRGISKEEIELLALCYWIRKFQHIILTGLTGSGKTWLACALAIQGIREGYSALYIRFSQLIEDYEFAEASGELPKLRKRLLKPNILILDDFGITPITPNMRTHLYDLIEQRDGNGSIIITTQLPINDWYDYIGEATVAETILDRIIHRAHKIQLLGEDSMRKYLHSVEENTDATES